MKSLILLDGLTPLGTILRRPIPLVTLTTDADCAVAALRMMLHTCSSSEEAGKP